MEPKFAQTPYTGFSSSMTDKLFDLNEVIGSNRSGFNSQELQDGQLDKDPFISFEGWLKEALEKGDPFANAMVLSTTGKTNLPDSRVVLLRNISYGGFTFYTNYQSKKGLDMAENPNACLLFFWKEQMRQVKIQGEIRFLPAKEAETYFAQRPFENQVSAWVSAQSQVVQSRQLLEEVYAKKLKDFEHKPVPKPPHWGGYVLLPHSFEFWQGKTDRLHHRIRYSFMGSGQQWLIERLMP